MRIAFVGLGKLGGLSALTFAKAGHQVIGYDPVPPVYLPEHENLLFALGMSGAVRDAEVVFIAVQTPHEPGYGGEVPMPAVPKGFDTSYLRAAVEQVRDACLSRKTKPTIAVVSTVLPGTCRTELIPILGPEFPFVYHPFFIAMGTVEEDLYQPEFVLLGSDHQSAAATVAKVYDPMHAKPRFHVGIESAEIVKVAYNGMVSMKILQANAIMEISEKVGADCDEVTDVLGAATDRVVSAKYLRGGMGDGCSCHPRDAIAMTYFANQLNLSADVFGFTVRTREVQTRWLASVVEQTAKQYDLPVVVMGRACKVGVDIEDGSAALLLCHYLMSY